MGIEFPDYECLKSQYYNPISLSKSDYEYRNFNMNICSSSCLISYVLLTLPSGGIDYQDAQVTRIAPDLFGLRQTLNISISV